MSDQFICHNHDRATVLLDTGDTFHTIGQDVCVVREAVTSVVESIVLHFPGDSMIQPDGTATLVVGDNVFRVTVEAL